MKQQLESTDKHKVRYRPSCFEVVVNKRYTDSYEWLLVVSKDWNISIDLHKFMIRFIRYCCYLLITYFKYGQLFAKI